MRRQILAILGMMLLGGATAVLATDPPAAFPATAPAEASPEVPGPELLHLLFSSQQTAAAILPCPAEPIVYCAPCSYYGQSSTLTCKWSCVNGVGVRSCSSCGTGCNN
jgi:hypothetical protein